VTLLLYCVNFRWCSPEVEVEVSIKVRSHVKGSAESSACRFHFLHIDLIDLINWFMKWFRQCFL
jgi:hypothetical protein